MVANIHPFFLYKHDLAQSSGPARASPKVIIGLDLIRFLAALMVVIYHFAHRAWAPPIERAFIRRLMPDTPPFPELEWLTWLGWVGVEIFFVISGFVIANSAEHSSVFTFLRSRVVRLAPAIWICATITLAVVCMLKGVDAAPLKTYLKSIAIPVFPFGPWIDSVYWTLVVELTFYGLILFLLAIDNFRRIEWLMVMLSLGSGGLWVLYGLTGVGESVLVSSLAQVLLIRHGCFFAVGILLWLLTVKRVTPVRLVMLGLALSGCLFEIAQLSEAKFDVLGRDLHTPSAQMVFLAGVAAIFASVRFNAPLTRLFRGSIETTRQLGLMTYPLYLVHNIVGVAFLNGLFAIGVGRYPSLWFAVLGVVALAWAISKTGEAWLAHFLKTLFLMIERSPHLAPMLDRLRKPTKPVSA